MSAKLTFGEKLTDLRRARSLTQEELGRAIHVASTTISSYENNSRIPRYHTLKKIAEFFNVTLDSLIGECGLEDSVILSDQQLFISHDGKAYTYKDILDILSGLEDIEKHTVIKVLTSLKNPGFSTEKMTKFIDLAMEVSQE